MNLKFLFRFTNDICMTIIFTDNKQMAARWRYVYKKLKK